VQAKPVRLKTLHFFACCETEKELWFLPKLAGCAKMIIITAVLSTES
jgi:hypothetical protein